MTTDVRTSPLLTKGLLYGLGLAALWVLLALISSTTTYHLAPLIVAGVPVIVDSSEQAGSTARLVLLATLGVFLALAVTAVLSVSGSLDGPSLLPIGGAALESVLFAIAGSLFGLVAAVLIGRR